jgi:acetolactate synthase I/II/III large subunit
VSGDNGADLVLRAIRAEGVDTAFMVPGGVNDAFMPPLTAPGMRTIVAAHEGGAAYMADGYARASGRFGVAFGIGGPGVFNMVTAIASARSDRTRVLAVSGEVATAFEGRGAFQDASGAGLDDAAVLRPVTGLSLAVENATMLGQDLRHALNHLYARDEPVHLSIPTDVQQAPAATDWAPIQDGIRHVTTLDDAAADAALATCAAAGRVAVLAGPGVRGADASARLLAFAERYGVPVATTLAAKGTMPEDHPLALGVFGYAGSRWATDALLTDDVDVLLVLGGVLTQRDTMYWDERMRPTTALIQVDADVTRIGRTWPAHPVVGDVGSALSRWLQATGPDAERFAAGADGRRAWAADVRGRGPRCYEAAHETSDAEPIHPARLIAELRRAAPRDTVLCVDSGAHRAWAGHYWESYGERDYLTATNLGPMGAALPLGIGAKLARPEAPVAVVVGDGCMLMHGLELHTAARHGIPLVVVVVNNRAYGNIWFRARTMGPDEEELTDIPAMDWAAFARSVGAEGSTVTSPQELPAALAAAFASGRPHLVDVHVDKTAEKPITPWTAAAKEWEDTH